MLWRKPRAHAKAILFWWASLARTVWFLFLYFWHFLEGGQHGVCTNVSLNLRCDCLFLRFFVLVYLRCANNIDYSHKNSNEHTVRHMIRTWHCCRFACQIRQHVIPLLSVKNEHKTSFVWACCVDARSFWRSISGSNIVDSNANSPLVSGLEHDLYFP